MTPRSSIRSAFVAPGWIAAIYFMISLGCAGRTEADTGGSAPTSTVPSAAPAPAPVRPAPAASVAPPETCLGVADRGIWPDLDPQIQLVLPAGLAAAQVSARIDDAHHVLVLSIDGAPRKVYPLGAGIALVVGAHTLVLRPGDHRELAPLLTAERLSIEPRRPSTGGSGHDRDGDGIPDPLDVLIGAKKTVANADAYTREAEGYIPLGYPMGDVPRSIGVCTDVIIRAVRNAGIDLQKELHDDIRRARAAYPMIKGMGDPSIDQRRVGSLLPLFRRHWERHTAALADPADPLRPGDVIFMDTFPARSGPDHIGILSDRLDDHGLPLVINNWTDGTVTAEMDLLTFVPVLERFRLPQ